MKNISAAVCAVILLISACKKNATPSRNLDFCSQPYSRQMAFIRGKTYYGVYDSHFINTINNGPDTVSYVKLYFGTASYVVPLNVKTQIINGQPIAIQYIYKSWLDTFTNGNYDTTQVLTQAYLDFWYTNDPGCNSRNVGRDDFWLHF